MEEEDSARIVLMFVLFFFLSFFLSTDEVIPSYPDIIPLKNQFLNPDSILLDSESWTLLLAFARC